MMRKKAIFINFSLKVVQYSPSLSVYFYLSLLIEKNNINIHSNSYDIILNCNICEFSGWSICMMRKLKDYIKTIITFSTQ